METSALSPRSGFLALNSAPLLFGVLSLLAGLILAPKAGAVTYTWNGNGSSVNWGVSGNWTGGTPVSASTTDLVFAGANNTGTLGTPLNQNIATPFLFQSITFTNTAGNFFLGGGSLGLQNTNGFTATITQNSANSQHIANAILHTGTSGNNNVNLVLAGNGAGVGTMARNITGGGGNRGVVITKTGSSTYRLTGVHEPASTAAVSINGGVLQFVNRVSLYNTAYSDWTADKIRVASGATFALNVGGAGQFTNADITELFKNLGASTSSTNGMAAGSIFGFDTTNAAGGNFTIGDIITNTTGATGGARGVTKLGTNTLTLTAANTYSGGTIVAAGRLLVNNTTGSGTGTGSVLVNGPATLGGTGFISGPSTVLGTHSPGISAGIQTFSSSLTYGDGLGATPSLVWELFGNTTTGRGTSFDGINVAGALSFLDVTSMNLLFNGTGSSVAWSNAFWTSNRSWLLFSGASGLSGLSNLMVNPQNWMDSTSTGFNDFFAGSANFTLSNLGNNVYLNFNQGVVPEPSRALLGLLGLLSLGLRRRRA